MKHPIPRPMAVLMLVATLVASGRTPTFSQEPAGRERNEEHRHDATVRHRFDDVERWVERFDDPARDEWQKPDEVIRFLGVDRESRIADIGAGTGYFSVRLARAVGPEGTVWAVDVEPSLVEYLGTRAEREELAWIRPVLAEPDDPKLPAGEVDLVLVVNTWHHIDSRLRYLDTLREALAPGGRVAIIDYREGDLPVGPGPGHKLSRGAVVAEFEKAGWVAVAEYEELPYQYALVFRPPRDTEPAR